MNIDVKMTYLKYLLLAGAMCAFVSCQREDGPLDLPENKIPIELSAASEWPDFTKALITSEDDLEGDGFVVWGDLHSNNTITSVFNGTEVTRETGEWDYSPKQYWFNGDYYFAALLPASKVKNNISAFITDDGSLKLNGGSITLGGPDADQIDLMYALSGKIENTESKEEYDPIALTFYHLWAQLGFNLQSVEPNDKSFEISKITLYGSGLYSSITFSEGEGTEADPDYTLTISENDYQLKRTDLYSNPTDSTNPFATFTPEDGTSWTVGTEAVPLVKGLMVFPVESSEDNSVTVEVTYGNGKTIKGTIDEVKWLSGKKYIYTLQIGANSINFKEPTVAKWGEGENFGVDINAGIVKEQD